MAQNWDYYDRYTPTLTATTTDPTMGAGAAAAGYFRQEGLRVWGYATFVFGTSAAAGTGAYGVLLPVAPADRLQPIGAGYLVDTSDANRLIVASAAVLPTIIEASASKALLLITNVVETGFSTGNNPVGAACPWTWADTDQIIIQFDYEAASS